METQNIAVIILILLATGMLIGVGVLTIDKFGRATRTSVTVTSTGENLSSASSVDFADTYCTNIVSVQNATASYDSSALSFSDADGCIITNTGITGCGPAASAYCNITYKYGADSTAATTASSVTSAITPIASTWLSLVVTVVVLSIIISMVINSFAGKR